MSTLLKNGFAGESIFSLGKTDPDENQLQERKNHQLVQRYSKISSSSACSSPSTVRSSCWTSINSLTSFYLPFISFLHSMVVKVYFASFQVFNGVISCQKHYKSEIGACCTPNISLDKFQQLSQGNFL
jgi:hypothetical protein